jgi:hypothetical protein
LALSIPARDNVDAPTRNDVYSVLVMKTFLDNSPSEVFVNEFPGELEFDAQDKHETSEFGNVNEFPGDIDLEDELGAGDNEDLITVIAMGMQSSRGTLCIDFACGATLVQAAMNLRRPFRDLCCRVIS